MKLILSGQKDEVVLEQTFALVKIIINAYFDNVIVSGQTLVFDYNGYTFVIVSRNINRNETLLALTQEVRGSLITEKAIIHNKKESRNELILPIENPAYYKANKIIVKTKKFSGVADIWEHINDFSDYVKAEKFAQMVTKKGFINTKYWIEYKE